jgi:hypothetical protein
MDEKYGYRRTAHRLLSQRLRDVVDQCHQMFKDIPMELMHKTITDHISDVAFPAHRVPGVVDIIQSYLCMGFSTEPIRDPALRRTHTGCMEIYASPFVTLMCDMYMDCLLEDLKATKKVLEACDTTNLARSEYDVKRLQTVDILLRRLSFKNGLWGKEANRRLDRLSDSMAFGVRILKPGDYKCRHQGLTSVRLRDDIEKRVEVYNQEYERLRALGHDVHFDC